ncbi:MAG TPA: hypothetical protein VNM48_01605 [Chloroflexota bacterium]|nr:hypothetical protein [Chloroflexota bacterium]
MIDNAWSLWVQVAILLGVLLNMGYAIIKRQWESQDMDRRAKALEREVDAKAEEVKQALALRNARLEADLEKVQVEVRHRDEIAVLDRALLARRVAESTAATKAAGRASAEAMEVANNVNEKIVSLHQTQVALTAQQGRDRTKDQTDVEELKDTTASIKETTEDTGRRMMRIVPDPAEPEPPAAERGEARPLRGPHQDQPT